MRNNFLGILILFLGILIIVCQSQTTKKSKVSSQNTSSRRCQKPKNGQHICFCGKNKTEFDRLKGEKCVLGKIVQPSAQSKPAALRLTTKPIHQSARDDNEKLLGCSGLIFKPSTDEDRKAYVPLRNVSVEAWIDSFAADVTLTQVFFNQEENNIEAIYVFPIEENAAVYSFTAQIDDRTITATLKEKKVAEEEYDSAIKQGQTAVLMRQSKKTLDTFTINIGALPPGKECRVKIQYVTELDLIDGSSIRFVVPTTIAPRYNPSLGHLQSPDNTNSEYVQKTPYSMWFQAHVLRNEQYKITQVANLSHAVNVSMSPKSIDVSLQGIALDRDIILDIDLPNNRPMTHVSIEQYNDTSNHAILLAFTPSLSDLMKVSSDNNEANTEFIFIVDCSGSMSEGSRIGLAKEALLLFIRSLPVGSHFNIIRFGSRFDILFKDEVLTTVYNEETAKKAEVLTNSISADFGGTELLEPLKYLKDHPPIDNRSRQIFLLTDGEISNTDEVIELCRSMSSSTRIFSFGLGDSASRSLVKGLARTTNGYFIFIPPNAKVDTYVGSQFGRALQPSLVNARLEWHGLSTNGSQAPKTIPPIYVDDRVLVYQLLEGNELKGHNISVDLMIGEQKINSIQLNSNIVQKKDTIRRLAAKALIQELQHENYNVQQQQQNKYYSNEDSSTENNSTEDNSSKNNSTLEQRITNLSLNHQILSPYTAFVGVETTSPKNNNTYSKVRHTPIQISNDVKQLLNFQPSYQSSRYSALAPRPSAKWRSSSYNDRGNYQSFQFGLAGPPGPSSMSGYISYNRIAFTTTSISTTTSSLLSTDPVRWLVNQQLFSGAWLLNDKEIKMLTKGKTLSTFTSTITQNRDALSTALAVAVLETKYADQKNLWNAVVAKGRKQLENFGVKNDQIDILINDMKKKL
ncbi:unnamed protein product [Adineta steineri]|uniref:Uncharacterized protein n=1 Tax=Adineta steineri TaxID=433720 RepID=A0A815DWA3_9BILA|nr:unnamed protein product [Adineta steineri]